MSWIKANKEALSFLAMILFAVIALFMLAKFDKSRYVNKPVVIVQQTSEITHDEVKLYLKQINVKFPEIVYAQSVLETGNFTSSVCYENNNLYGMKISTKRPTTAIGSRNGYATYRTWQESVLDYALYQAYYFDNVKTVDEYLDSIGNYAEDSTYIAKIKVIAKQF